MMSKSRSESDMETSKPRELISRSLEARHTIRQHLSLETALIERIAELPEDDFCSTDIESLQLGAGYAQLLYEQGERHGTADAGPDATEAIIEAFFAMRPRNRYLHEHEVAEHHKQVHEAVVTPELELPEHLDPYEVSAASLFMEGYLKVAEYHDTSSAPRFDTVD
jgi:hypothetical protein